MEKHKSYNSTGLNDTIPPNALEQLDEFGNLDALCGHRAPDYPNSPGSPDLPNPPNYLLIPLVLINHDISNGHNKYENIENLG